MGQSAASVTKAGCGARYPSHLRGEQTVGVVLGGLLVEIELTAASGVMAHPGDVLPIAVVTPNVKVDQVLFKEGGAKPPVTLQFVD